MDWIDWALICVITVTWVGIALCWSHALLALLDKLSRSDDDS